MSVNAFKVSLFPAPRSLLDTPLSLFGHLITYTFLPFFKTSFRFYLGTNAWRALYGTVLWVYWYFNKNKSFDQINALASGGVFLVSELGKTFGVGGLLNYIVTYLNFLFCSNIL